MIKSENTVGAMDAHRADRRDRSLMFGFVTSIIGLPIGIALGLPIVWGLAIVGIVIGGIKLYLRHAGTQIRF